MNHAPSVRLEYRLVGTTEWIAETIGPSEYFDLEGADAPESDSLPRYNHAAEYLSVPLAELAETRVVVDYQEDGRQTIHETFWGDGKQRLIERHEEGAHPYRELTICCEIQADPHKLEILRMIDRLGQMEVTSHVIIETLPDGSEREVRLFRRRAH